MKRSLRTWSHAALLVAALTATVASAESPKDQARKHVDKANVHYKLGRFPQALEEYSKAYELFGAPALLFNLGQCHRELKNYERATFFFEGYLRERPNAKNRALVEELLAESRRLLEAQEAERRATEERKRAEERRLNELTAASRPAPFLPGSSPAERATPIYKKWWLWTAVAVVVAAAATGGSLGYYYSGSTTRVLPAGSLGTLDRR
jgi:tetratricopeptide (TPR) repeat protein